jgi:iron(III) transport system substrate-binding protein
MIAVSTRPEHAALVARIKSMQDLIDPALRGKIGICNPALGTAAGHFASLYVLWGEEKYTQYLRALRANQIKLLGGNSVVAEQTGAGSLVAGPTDNDDIANGIAEGMKLQSVVPDQQEGGIGTLLIPTTVALVKGAPNAENARKLIDFLLAQDVEKELIDGRYLAFSVRDSAAKARAMDVDYVQVAHQMKRATELALSILQDR